LRDESGATAIEYAMIASGIACHRDNDRVARIDRQ
jgi:Flp/Fap pilin component